MNRLIIKELSQYITLIKKEAEAVQYCKEHFLVLFRGQPVDQRSFDSELIKLSTAKSGIISILEDLNLCGINTATLFPDLDGVSDYINWKQITDKYIKVRMPQLAL